jgi:hypothetical protein
MRTCRLLFYAAVIGCSATFLFSCGNSANTPVAKTGATQLAANAEANALPYDLEFVAQSYPGKPPLPCLQSYVSAMSKDGYLLIIGGRRQGLHTFEGYPNRGLLVV